MPNISLSVGMAMVYFLLSSPVKNKRSRSLFEISEEIKRPV
jgi:hypothetical protein